MAGRGAAAPDAHSVPFLEPADMDCGVDGALYGSCSSHDTWLSASEVPSDCTGNTRLSTASTDTHFTTTLHHISSDGFAHIGRQRCIEPSVDVVAIAR